MEKKNNNLVIILMGGIIVILAVLCVLFATGTIDLKSNNIKNDDKTITEKEKDKSVNTSGNNSGDENNIGDSNTENSNIERYFQNYEEYATGQWKTKEIKLNKDKTVELKFGGTGSGGDEYIGTYTEDDNTIVLTLTRKMPDNNICEDDNTVFPCKAILTFNKNNDDKITGDWFGETKVQFSKVDIEKLKMIK